MQETKKCTKCGEVKPLEDFHKKSESKDGRRSICMVCRGVDIHKIRDKYIINKKGLKKCYICDTIKKHSKFRIDNSSWDGYKTRCISCVSAYDKLYREKHKDELNRKNRIYKENNKESENRRHREYIKKRYHNDLNFKLICNLRSSIWGAFNKSPYTKKSNRYKILGALQHKIIKHLNNNTYGFIYGKGDYQVDHIIAIASCESEEDLINILHYTNLQLLPSKYNNLKRDKKWDRSHFEKWLIETNYKVNERVIQ